MFPFYLQGEFRAIGWGVHSWGVGVGEGPRGTNAISPSTRILVPIATNDSLYIGIIINESLLRISD